MPSVVWRRHGIEITENEQYSLVEHRDGSRQLIICQPTENDNGTYTCTAENSVKTVRISHVVDITEQLKLFEKKHKVKYEEEDITEIFKEKLMFETFLKNITVEEGKSTKFICSVKGSVSDRNVQWLKDGKPVDFDSNSKYFNSFKGGLIILEVAQTHTSDSGEFTCLIRKGASEIATTSKLFVYSKSPDTGSNVPVSFSRSLKGLPIDDCVPRSRMRSTKLNTH